MLQSEALRIFHQWSCRDRVIFTHQDLRKLFPGDSEAAFRASLGRLIRAGYVQRVTQGIYFYALAGRRPHHLLEQIAVARRRGCYNYLSLESALAEYGVISQVPLAVITVMTTGRSGIFDTPYGRIEFTHTKRTVNNILVHTKEVGRPCRLATPATAFTDLKRVGRNLHLVDEEELAEVMADVG
ncbi:MAG: hypothetical protein OXC02_03960 [Rhodobacteraceae bacterium]|nr:hypothetical protein [Paracoccaceae bacterium]